MSDIPTGILTNLLSEFIVVVLGVLFAQFILNRWEERRYGRWQVIVIDPSGAEHIRPISPRKARQILDEPADLSVFLKGVASAYGQINVDLITEGRASGLLQEDRTARRFTVDMRKQGLG
ncbi:MAG: hypothetical protein WAZ19_14835 [Anaerolineae bacterium]